MVFLNSEVIFISSKKENGCLYFFILSYMIFIIIELVLFRKQL